MLVSPLGQISISVVFTLHMLLLSCCSVAAQRRLALTSRAARNHDDLRITLGPRPVFPRQHYRHVLATRAGRKLLEVAANSAAKSIRETSSAAADVLRIAAQPPNVDDDQDKALRAWLLTVPAPPAPAAWKTLERKAATGGREGVAEAFDKRRFEVPPIEGSAGARCQLTPDRTCRRFRSDEINNFLVDLFLHIVQHPDLPDFALNRFDLFHAHLFVGNGTERLGLLFHAQEYPAYDQELFPLPLGFCQVNSTVEYHESKMQQRNILWWGGALHVLNVGSPGPLFESLLPEGLGAPVYTDRKSVV